MPRSNKTTEYVKAGSKAMLQCEAEGVPEPTITWQRHERYIKNTAKYQLATYSETDNKIISELQFKVDMNDSGKYKCIASNQHGQSHVSILLKGNPYFII